eukprot:TRINITY_DN3753_c0_g1_i3.p2 TRINITY_DN3753_c0_g1~~TRINITY_DN3753_c0_g1_i3.p2  ORF type:complete len:275 (+),score=110.81 TRINITY_DN3753_c0_g1_i3:3-827(+)
MHGMMRTVGLLRVRGGGTAAAARRAFSLLGLGTRVAGPPGTMDYSVFTTLNGREASPWHDIPFRAADGTFHYVNEIPKGTKAKLEVSTKVELNPIKQDLKKGKLRFFAYDIGANGIPFNYGSMPQTFEDPDETHPDTGHAGDADPLDLVELGASPLPVGAVRRVKVLGCLAMIDEGETDWKVVCIDAEDPKAKGVDTVADWQKTPEGQKQLAQVVQWFRYYKTPDGKPENTFAFDGRYQDRDYALRVIDEVHASWRKLLDGKIPNKKGWWLPRR